MTDQTDRRGRLFPGMDEQLRDNAPSTVAPTTDRAALSAKLWEIAEHHIVAEWICCEPLEPGHTLCAKGYAALGMAKTLLVDSPEAWNPDAPLLDAVLAMLPAPADRAAVLREAAERYDRLLADIGADTAKDPRYWTGVQHVAIGLRCMADETRQAEVEVVHGCPPDGSGLTPCCGQTPFELPLSDRISSEAPVTCPGAAAAQQPKEAEGPRTVCVCGHTRAEHATVSGRLLCDVCVPGSTENLTCEGFEAL